VPKISDIFKNVKYAFMSNILNIVVQLD